MNTKLNAFFIATFIPFFALSQIDNKVLEELSFRNIGPAGMSGRITSIDVDPSTNNIIYAGSASGGLWRSLNAGQSWNSIWDDQPTAGLVLSS